VSLFFLEIGGKKKKHDGEKIKNSFSKSKVLPQVRGLRTVTEIVDQEEFISMSLQKEPETDTAEKKGRQAKEP
jgi:PII-like signaling protein